MVKFVPKLGGVRWIWKAKEVRLRRPETRPHLLLFPGSQRQRVRDTQASTRAQVGGVTIALSLRRVTIGTHAIHTHHRIHRYIATLQRCRTDLAPAPRFTALRTWEPAIQRIANIDNPSEIHPRTGAPRPGSRSDVGAVRDSGRWILSSTPRLEHPTSKSSLAPLRHLLRCCPRKHLLWFSEGFSSFFVSAYYSILKMISSVGLHLV